MKIFEKNKSGGGFTLIELLMVVVIILILSTIILANYSAGQKQLALSRAAHKLSQDLRRAQEMAMSAKDFTNNPSATPTPSKGGYGIYFNLANPTKYSLFADCDNEKDFDNSGSAPSCFAATTTDPYRELVEEISIEKDVKISNVSPGPSLAIIFNPPNPEVNFNPDGSSTSTITLSIDGKQKKVIVNKAGLIAIE